MKYQEKHIFNGKSTFNSPKRSRISNSPLVNRVMAGTLDCSSPRQSKSIDHSPAGNGDVQWSFSQVKGTLDDDVTEADIISCVEFNHDGELLATGDKGGRVVIFQRDPVSKTALPKRGEYNVYSTFQSHEPEFDYLKSLEIEEKINKIRWLRRKNPAHFLLSTNDKTIKLWKVSERDKRVEGNEAGYNTKSESGSLIDPVTVSALRVPIIKPMELMVEASPRRIFANAHTYHINSISVNSDQETYLSADDLRINLWHLEITDQSFNIVDIKPTNMEELTEVITAAEFHPVECNLFVYSSSKGTIRLCDMRAAALCDRHAKLFEEPESPTTRSFFSEIISSISDVKLSNNGRYMISRDYLSVKVWDLHMESKPIETYPDIEHFSTHFHHVHFRTEDLMLKNRIVLRERAEPTIYKLSKYRKEPYSNLEPTRNEKLADNEIHFEHILKEKDLIIEFLDQKYSKIQGLQVEESEEFRKQIEDKNRELENKLRQKDLDTKVRVSKIPI
ncbi:unnamed protein product [Phaedon cochleariae]|uniref:Serine/threonine-protein phosphatase 2A 55 kDa regulatory subunit B n=1 Tax=Phaedon cochleariae TaxID=80249 RepID=A0A9N9SG94_PHACE|nr:unnamed protein product [Phaedon cochleariae]